MSRLNWSALGDRLSSALCLATLAIAANAGALEVARADDAREPSAPRSGDADPEAVFRAFEIHTAERRVDRITGAIGGIVAGGLALGLGPYVADRTDTSSTPWWIAGGVVAGAGFLQLLIPSASERIASEAKTGGGPHTAEQARALEEEWQALAEQRRREREIAGIIGLVLGTGTLATGIAVLAGAADFERDDRALIGGLLVGGGAGALVAGGRALLTPAPAEQALRLFRSARPAGATIELSLGAGVDGASLFTRGTF